MNGATIRIALILGIRSCALVIRLAICGCSLFVIASASAHPVGVTSNYYPLETSPAVIPYDANGVVEASGDYVSGNSGTVTGPFAGTNINSAVGAGTFYTNGYTGSNAAVANIEAGHIWNGHEALATATQITNHPNSLNEVDRHATWVGLILAGRQAGGSAGVYQEGIAPNAKLYSGAISAQWSGTRFATSFSYFFSAFFDQYRHAFNTGMDGAGRKADVINISWGGGDVAGTSTTTLALDGFANINPSALMVIGAGNSGVGPNQVMSPASGYNNMSVAALGPDSTYNTASSFSSGGPNNYQDPVNGTITNIRQVVDIAAPGQQQSSAYYGGETGGNGTTDNPSISGTGPTGAANGPAGGSNFYSRGIAGTSFTAPTVAGGAALLYDAAYATMPGNPNARDARVIKSVLMNSANKTPGWNNGQTANGQGGVNTTMGLDNRVGAGSMNLDKAYYQFLSGTEDVAGLGAGNLGVVNTLGWDFGQVASGLANDYFIGSQLLGGSTFTATLTWFRDRRVDGSNNVFDDSFDNLDLELWKVVAGTPTTLISQSNSIYNENEHFSFLLPTTDNYAIRVRWTSEVFDVIGDANQELYGLAWDAVAVPEPSTMILVTFGVAGATLISRRRRLWPI